MTMHGEKAEYGNGKAYEQSLNSILYLAIWKVEVFTVLNSIIGKINFLE